MNERPADGAGVPLAACPVPGATVPFGSVSSPGAYICNWNGHLLRIPERTIVPSDALRLETAGREPLMVTKISDDPGVPLVEARALALQLGLLAGF
jgi:hypothetical protein